MSEQNEAGTGAEAAQKFGTFLGVYTPSVLTILGLIMYLRFGWVVGNVGLPLTLLMVLLASSITFITALSASALATNMRVGVGGEYFMVARSLGLELGGAIGIPLFLCRTLSITFYSFGLAEAILWLRPPAWGEPPGYLVPLIAAVTVVVDHRHRRPQRRACAEAADPDHDRRGRVAPRAAHRRRCSADSTPPRRRRPTRTAPAGSGTSSPSSSRP